ncbi:hypothetical protein [Desulfolucanica intricata]|uniref:hypothetical protein n=1 Tax=Desulfolucanica intricata TaxID=1285191 RepID=UPI000834CB9D|nr:hypothetical protein [Desulfolucanica intricata]
MDENKEFELELSDETLKKVGEYAQKSGKTEDQVIEYILKEFIQDQLHVFNKIAEKKGKTINEILNRQFKKTLESLLITQK